MAQTKKLQALIKKREAEKTRKERERNLPKSEQGKKPKKKPKTTVLPTIQLKRKGETVTAAESERRSEERRKTAEKTTVLPTIQLKKKEERLLRRQLFCQQYN